MSDPLCPILATLSITNEENLLAKHRKERKELQAKVQALKKSADKKRKREVLLEIAALETALDQRHDNELQQLAATITADDSAELKHQKNDNEDDDDDDNKLNGNAQQNNQQPRISKAQKRRDKKATAERQLRSDIAAQDELNKTGARTVETNTINALLRARQLQLHAVPSDGDCLYNAVAQQLVRTGRGHHTVASLRSTAADYIELNADALRVYMTNSQTGDCLNDAEFEQYCMAVRSTAAWGGQLEIKALSNALRVPIEVLQATGPPTLQNEGEFAGAALVLTYHRHMYSLGEHYNATTSTTAHQRSNEVEVASSSDEGAASK